MECGSFKGIKLLEHVMKVAERVFEYRIWLQSDIGIKFGFMEGKGTDDDIFYCKTDAGEV